MLFHVRQSLAVLLVRPIRLGFRAMKRVEKKHPLAIRWFHWINFPVLAVMLWSGLLIYWANDVYRVGAGGIRCDRQKPACFFI